MKFHKLIYLFTILLLTTCSPKTGEKISDNDDVQIPIIEKKDAPVLPDEPAIEYDIDVVFRDFVYDPNIKTVLLHPEGRYIDLPVYVLNSQTQLELSFDDLNGNVEDYNYTFVLCNADWTPNDLSPYEYIDGFTEQYFFNYNYSFGTLQDFTHYKQYIPSSDMQITKSGNYLLKVWRGDDEENVVITKRFYVVDEKVTINGKSKRPSFAEYHTTHQEIDFDVVLDDAELRNAFQEVNVSVMQNGRWDNELMNLKPLFVRDNVLIYDYSTDIIFPAGKEFRYADLRSLRMNSESVASTLISSQNDLYLYSDPVRSYQQYFYRTDINGNYFVETKDQGDDELEADYCWVHFYLPFTAPLQNGVYVFGKFSNWDLLPGNKMEYNVAEQQYEATILLKQGYYNYEYAVWMDDGTFDQSIMEGNYFEAENNYTIMVYYRPFGERYDQLIGIQTINSLYQF